MSCGVREKHVVKAGPNAGLGPAPQAPPARRRRVPGGHSLLFGVDCSTDTRAVGDIRELLAECRDARSPTALACGSDLPDVFAYAQVARIELRQDATEIQVCRLPVGRGRRLAIVLGKKKLIPWSCKP